MLGLPAIVLLLKVTALLGITWLGAAALRRQSAAVRHFVWALGLAAAFVLPILTGLVPQLGFRIPATQVQPAVEPAPPADRPFVTNISRTPDQELAREHSTEAAATAARASAAIDSTRQRQWLAFIWLAGVVVVLSRIALGHLGLTRLARRAEPLVDDGWRSLLDDALAQAGVSTRVRFCCSANVGAPVTWGWRSPVVVLPVGADGWPVDRRSMALEHELAHVARRDYLTQLGCALVCAAYWFHPLVWFAARRLRVEGEHACDDRVLAGGTNAPDYATQLLAVASGARGLRLAAGASAVCMARPSHLEGRLLALLDDARPRRGLPTRARLAAIVSIGAFVIPLAGLHPVAGADKRVMDDEALSNSSNEISESVDVSPGDLLTLDLDTGGDVDLRGWDENRVEVKARLDGTDWLDTRVDIDQKDGGVRVAARQRGRKNGNVSTSHTFEIRVPRRFDLRLDSAGGKVTIIDVEGSLRGQTGGGDIVLERVKGDVHLSTGGGEIEVTDVDARGSVTTGGGMVRMSRVRGGLRGSSGSGPVIYAEEQEDSKDGAHDHSMRQLGDLDGLRVDDSGIEDGRTDSRGLLHIERAGGDVVLHEAPHGARIETGGGEIRVGRAGGDVEATTGGGDIDIGPVVGSVVASTGAGTVHVRLDDAPGKEQTVEVSAGVGRIVVELPEGFDGEFDLETAYTKKHGQARIDSSWKLEHEATTNWDDSEGTPRRYVRAHGIAGRGRGRVHIRTVNGDIIVKRGGGEGR